MGFKSYIAIALVAGLCACAGESTQPYWDDAAWMRTFQGSFHLSYPSPAMVNADGKSYTATVDIAYANGKFDSVSIVKSTGLDAMDKFIVAQIQNTQLPVAAGPQRLDPHDFQVDVVMDPGFKEFGLALNQSITAQTVTALRGDWSGNYGYVLVQFYYLDGKIYDATILYNDSVQKLGQDVLAKMLQVKLPDAIPALVGQRWRLIVGFCFLDQQSDCEVRDKRARESVH